jgi:hypothetical protein
MKLKIMKIIKKPSKYGGHFYYLYLKDTTENGKSYKSCLSSNYRNFAHWRGIINRFNPDGKYDYFITNARLKGNKGNVIDADTVPLLQVTPRE